MGSATHNKRGRAAVFLDRDGVIVEPVSDVADGRPEGPLRPSDVRLAPRAVEGIGLLHRAGFVLVVVSNQPSAAKGKATRDDLRAVHERTVELLGSGAAAIADWRYCFHHPDAVAPELRGPCACRKPAPGMLLDAAQDLGLDLGRSWMVGDSDADLGAAQAAGVAAVLIEHPDSVHRRTGRYVSRASLRNLGEAAAFIRTTQALATLDRA